MHKIIFTALLTALLLNAQLSLAADSSGSTGRTTINGVTHIPAPVKVSANNDVATLVMDAAAQPSVTVNVIANDTNAGKAILISSPIGQYGYLDGDVNAASGSYTYKLDMTNPSVRALAEGQTLTETFIYQAKAIGDERVSSDARLIIYILGPKVKPIAYADTATVEVDLSKPEAVVSLNVKANDRNAGDVSLLSSPAGKYGYLDPGINPAEGLFKYKVDLNNSSVKAMKAGGRLVETFTYRVGSPGNGPLTSEATISITLLASTAAAPLAYADTASVEADLSKPEAVVSLNVKANDSNAGDVALVSSPVGKYGYLDPGVNPAEGLFKYRVDLNNAAVKALKTGSRLVETFTYRVKAPGNGTLTSEGVITINIVGATTAALVVKAVEDIATVVMDSSVVNPSVALDVLSNDINADKAALVSSSVGKYGYIEGGLSGDGKMTYRVDKNSPAVQKLFSTPGAKLSDTFVYKATAKSPNERISAQGTVTINIVAGNLLVVKAVEDVATLLVDSATLNPSVKLNVLANDINADKASLVSSPIGQYGAIDGGLGSDGNLTYRVDKNNPTVQKLLSTAGTKLVDTFTYSVTAKSPNEQMSAQGTIRFYIVAGNVVSFKAFDFVESIVAEEALLSSTTTATAATSAAATVTGNLKEYNNGLLDLNDTTLRAEILSAPFGQYGYLQFSSSTSKFTYTLNTNISEVQALRNSGNALQDLFKYRLTNRYGVTAEATIIINIVSRREQVSTDNVEIESNNQSSLATPLNSGAYMRGNLMHSSDRDWYFLSSSGNEILNFELCPQGFACSNQKAWVLYIFDGDKLTQEMEAAKIPLVLKRDDTGAVLDTGYADHLYLLYNAGVFDDALLGVIDPCWPEGNGKTTVDIGTPTLSPGTTRNYFVAISSPLARSGDGSGTKLTCSGGNVVLTKPGPSFDEQTAPSTTTSTVGNTSSTTTSTTKKVTTTQQYISIFPNSDDQYTFKVTRTGVSPIAVRTSKDEAVYTDATGSLQIPKVRVGDQLYAVQLQPAPTAKAANSHPVFGISGVRALTEPVTANAYLGTYNPINNMVRLPKVKQKSTAKAYSVDLRYKPNNTLELLSVTPLEVKE